MASTPSESRARQLLGKGANVEAVMNATGLSKGAVITIRNAMKLPPDLRQSAPAADALPVAKPAPRAPEPQQETKRRRWGMPECFKDWHEDDYQRFIEFWQATPNREKACEAEGITQDELDWLLGTLKRNGVMLKVPQKIAINFEQLKTFALSKLTPEETAAMKARSEKARERLADMRARKAKKKAA